MQAHSRSILIIQRQCNSESWTEQYAEFREIYSQKKVEEKNTKREHTFLSQNRIAENGHTEHTDTHTHMCQITFIILDLEQLILIFPPFSDFIVTIIQAFVPLGYIFWLMIQFHIVVVLICFIVVLYSEHSSNFHADFIWMKIQQTQSQWNHELCYSDLHD